MIGFEIVRSRGLFSEVGVSQLLESEWLLCCLRLNSRLLRAKMESCGDLRPISESIGNSVSRGTRSAASVPAAK